jgi:hypothetical protein
MYCHAEWMVTMWKLDYFWVLNIGYITSLGFVTLGWGYFVIQSSLRAAKAGKSSNVAIYTLPIVGALIGLLLMIFSQLAIRQR